MSDLDFTTCDLSDAHEATIQVVAPGFRRFGKNPKLAGTIVTVKCHEDNTLVKALARAHRWKKMLDDGRYGSVTELAAEYRVLLITKGDLLDQERKLAKSNLAEWAFTPYEPST